MAPLIGNPRALAAVQRALASGSPPHAWLFDGPAGVGKASLARLLAQAVNCERNAIGASGVAARHAEHGPITGDIPPGGGRLAAGVATSAR